ncbi:NAD-dependent epimerase/dehydratase family protein, partial [Halorubrum sp. SP9]
RDWTVMGTYHSTRPKFEIPLTQFDLVEYEAFDEVLETHDPGLVINCAAMTDVDGCEKNPEQANVLNSDAPGALADQCAANDVEFVHVSTDYVFDGTARDPYGEEASPNPVQVYGESKLAGERAVQEADGD